MSIYGEGIIKKIAAAIAPLELQQKQSMKQMIEIIQNSQGVPLDKLPPIDQNLMILAKKTGILNPAIISSTRGLEKEFEFTPDLLKTDSVNEDILDDVKLLLASIRFGENYTEYSTIQEPEKFLRALINNQKVGPHSANGSDYILLENEVL